MYQGKWGDNPQVQLSYVSFMNWTTNRLNYGNYYDRENGWVAFGLDTPANAVPRTGSAHYTALLAGQSEFHIGGNGRETLYNVGGSGSFLVDFGGGGITGYLNPILTDTADGSVRNLGQHAFDGVRLRAAENYFSGALSRLDYGYVGDIEGRFAGSDASEMYGRWNMSFVEPTIADNIPIFGIFVGKKN